MEDAGIGTDAIEWPAAAADVHLHLSPPCQKLSRAAPAPLPGEKADALQALCAATV